MNIFQIKGNDILESKYQGSGVAIGAVYGGQLIDIIYLRDVFPDLDEEDEKAVQAALNDQSIAPTVRKMQALGEVFVGMCSCYEFEM